MAIRKKKSEDNKTAENKTVVDGEIKLSPQAKAIIFFGSAILLFALMLYPGENVWNMVYKFFKGVFGCLAFLWPCLLTYLGVITAKEKEINGKTVNKLVLFALAIVMLSSCMFLFGYGQPQIQGNYFECLGQLYINGMKDFSNGSAAGLFGGLLGYPLVALCGFTAAEILCVLILIIDLMFFFGITVKDVYVFASKPFKAIKKSMAQADFEKKQKDNSVIKQISAVIEERKKRFQNRKNSLNKNSKKQEFLKKSVEANSNFDDGFESDYIDIADLKNQVNAVKAAKDAQRPETIVTEYEDLSSNDVLSSDDDFYSSSSRDKLLNVAKSMNSENSDKAGKGGILDKVVMPKGDDEQKLNNKKLSKKEELVQAQDEISKQINESLEDGETCNYRYPPVELLYPSGSREDTQKAMEELERNGNKLESTLKSFGVNASIVNICRGPSVTRFEVQPAPGVKISKITNLSDDIALNLAASGVRIEAPIPGKAAVGIEVPNKVVTMVSMRELIDSNKFKSAQSKLSVVLGKDISGNTIVTDLSKMPHLLIAGTTGSGKSVCVNSILISLLYKANPDEVKMLLIDPKMVEFSKYKGIPHLLIPVVTDPKKAAGALNWAVNEMENRYKTFSAFGVRDIAGYNSMIESYNKIRSEKSPEELEEEPLVNSEGIPIPEEKMASIVIAIDEFADLMMTAPNEVEDSICRLAQKARAAGMHLVVATQRPTVNVITGVIKANIPSRISLKVSSQLDSRTILDVGGAEKLIGRGDMLFAPIGAAKPLRVQGCYASDAEIENVTSYVKKDNSSQYNMKIQEEIEKITEMELTKGKDKDNDSSESGSFSDDEMMEEAIKLVVENGQASTSLLQRRLRLGYARAGRLIDEMEQMGIVGPHVGSKSREVLMSYQQWLERQNNMSQ
ncbi:MAG: DNA translocase FtsK 4TM domain-containing protein [Acutalibacteraceae bacterium]|nr:DNA translocase FtsK 4TM domain-containing protein [Acutalibacteraceae bacterium]